MRRRQRTDEVYVHDCMMNAAIASTDTDDDDPIWDDIAVVYAGIVSSMDAFDRSEYLYLHDPTFYG